MERKQIVLAILLLVSIISCFLPWLTADVTIDGEARSTTSSGYEYIIPLGALYTAPVAILCVIGFILSAYSFRATQRTKMLNIIAGVLILIGVFAAFSYTSSVALGEATGSYNFSINVLFEYGLGLEALFGFLILIFGASAKAKPSQTQKTSPSSSE
jgi:hypothetical protein